MATSFLADHPRLLAVMQSFVGADIAIDPRGRIDVLPVCGRYDVDFLSWVCHPPIRCGLVAMVDRGIVEQGNIAEYHHDAIWCDPNVATAFFSTVVPGFAQWWLGACQGIMAIAPVNAEQMEAKLAGKIGEEYAAKLLGMSTRTRRHKGV